MISRCKVEPSLCVGARSKKLHAVRGVCLRRTVFFQELAMGGSYRRSGAEPSFCVLGSFRCNSTQTAGADLLLRKGCEILGLLWMLCQRFPFQHSFF